MMVLVIVVMIKIIDFYESLLMIILMRIKMMITIVYFL